MFATFWWVQGKSFVLQALVSARVVFTALVSRCSQAGTTYDGRMLDFVSGELLGPAWTFSAASKESLHIPLLAAAAAGNPLAQLLYVDLSFCAPCG